MHDARDEEDRRLLAAGEYARLVESYYGVILDRCRARVRPEDAAIAVAAEVAIRLLTELKRGKTYSVEYRRIVHSIITFKINEHFAPGKITEVEFDERLHPAADDSFAQFESDFDLDVLFAELPERARRVVELRWRQGLSIDQIAEMLGMTRNAVDQALHRAHGILRERIAQCA